MSIYTYRATTKTGQTVSNTIEGNSIQDVKEKLRVNGLTPINVRQQKGLISRLKPAQRSKKNQVSSAAVTKLAREK